MEKQAMIDQQMTNLKKAYNRSGLDYSALAKIQRINQQNKQQVNNMVLNGENTLVFKKPLTHDEIVCSLNGANFLTDYFFHMHRHTWSFNFQVGNVTQRETGKCYPLKKWFNTLASMVNPEVKETILSAVGQYRQIVLSTDSSFLLGSSVCSGGYQLDSSCHYPTDHGDYCSGSTSYAVDRCTVGAFIWDNDGIIGRCMIYFDTVNNGFVTGRRFGNISESDMTFIRTEIYKLLKTPAYNRTKSSEAFYFDTDGYAGYLDDGYFIGYRNNHVTIRIVLSSPVCIDCGDWHGEGSILCNSCNGNADCCNDCGDRLRDEDVYHDDNGYAYCGHHYYQRFFRCRDCGEEFYRDSAVDINGFDHCSDCASDNHGYSVCGYCGDFVPCSEHGETGEYYCSDCMPESVETENADN